VLDQANEAQRQRDAKRHVPCLDDTGSTAEGDEEQSMIELADLRRYALAFPDVEEKPHFRLPAFRAADKLLVHLEKGDRHAIVCVGKEEAKAATVEQPDVYEEVWREHGRIFVGLRVDLAKISKERMQELIEHAWRYRVPKRVAAAYDSR
jgi:hypothetical protein